MMDVPKVLGQGFVALRRVSETAMAMAEKAGAETRDDVDTILDALEEVQYVYISIQEELIRLQQENHRLEAMVKELESKR